MIVLHNFLTETCSYDESYDQEGCIIGESGV